VLAIPLNETNPIHEVSSVALRSAWDECVFIDSNGTSGDLTKTIKELRLRGLSSLEPKPLMLAAATGPVPRSLLPHRFHCKVCFVIRTLRHTSVTGMPPSICRIGSAVKFFLIQPRAVQRTTSQSRKY